MSGVRIKTAFVVPVWLELSNGAGVRIKMAVVGALFDVIVCENVCGGTADRTRVADLFVTIRGVERIGRGGAACIRLRRFYLMK